MKSISKFIALLLLLFFVLSCSDDDGTSLEGTDISISDIQGNWNAIRAIFGLAGEGPVVEFDVLEEGGSATLAIQANGRFTLTLNIPGEGVDTITGQMSFDEDLLVVEFDDSPGESEFFGIQSTATTLSINGPAEFDFDGDGTDEPAEVELDFVRA
ncbi:hypothetical protein [Flagellimonas meishanensis]|uniref:hypothetical protein n=1 Tax=Flagellimonas meishanensis TaxID=2873264 RepID=UPI001CA654EC|nr:hypothetical protein [[Muricauda] meishanensis]